MHVTPKSMVMFTFQGGAAGDLRAAYEKLACFMMAENDAEGVSHGIPSATRFWRRMEKLDYEQGKARYERVVRRLARYLHYRDFVETWRTS